MTGNEPARQVRADGTYETVPLRKPDVSISIVQTRVRGVDGDNPGPIMKENLDYILERIDWSQQGARSDLLCFHEFPIQGFRQYSKEQTERIAFDLDCDELTAIAAKAKQYNCYINMGALVKLPDWPGHTMNMQLLFGPEGKLIANHWKQRARRGSRPGTEQINTCIYDVLDRYVEMYGWDAVIPVERTDIGNIAMSAVQYEPELFRAQAMKGAELLLRTATGGFRWEDMQMCAYHNNVIVTMVNNSLNTYSDRRNFEEVANTNDWVGRSSIWGTKGVVLAEANKFETRRRAVIDMQNFRDTRQQPDVHFSLYEKVYADYQERFPPNLWSEHRPADKREGYRILHAHDRWKAMREA